MNRSYNIYALAVLPALLLAAAGVLAIASPVTIPNTFVPGQVADANQVNQNFQALDAAVDDNDARITALESPTATSTMLARCILEANGTNTSPWTSTGTAIATGKNGTGDFWIEVGGQTLSYTTHSLVLTPINVATDYGATAGSASSIGHGGGFRIRTWNSGGAAADVPAGVLVTIFNP